MKLKPGVEEKYAEWKTKNAADPYGTACFTYAEAWADLIEKAMADGAKLEDVAEKLSHDADTEGITGFMYGMAVNILSMAWEHGEQLRIWHNLSTQIGNEGERANKSGGVLNPALLNIGEEDKSA